MSCDTFTVLCCHRVSMVTQILTCFPPLAGRSSQEARRDGEVQSTCCCVKSWRSSLPHDPSRQHAQKPASGMPGNGTLDIWCDFIICISLELMCEFCPSYLTLITPWNSFCFMIFTTIWILWQQTSYLAVCMLHYWLSHYSSSANFSS